MNRRVSRRDMVAGILAAGLVFQTACSDPGSRVDLEPITVYKSPTCDCCRKWLRHLVDNGFEVKAINRKDMHSVKAELGVPHQLASCHTATVGGYIIEGHVPATDIKRLLQEGPGVAGLTVPGMPVGSPGMEGPQPVSYDVLTFTETGDTAVFSRY